jgi:hypothetical protein
MLGKDHITNRAVLSIGSAGLCAGRRNAGINHLGMSERSQGLLSHHYGRTDRTGRSVAEARLCASGSISAFDYFLMAVRLNNLLFFDDLVTNRAVLTGGKSVLGTGGRYALIYNLGVNVSVIYRSLCGRRYAYNLARRE